MQKQFTIRMPDELYVPGFAQSKISTFTYSGDSTVFIKVNTEGSVVGPHDPEQPLPVEDSNELVVELDAATFPDVAHFVFNPNPDTEYVFEDEVNHDGSTYQKVTNPRLQDVYRLRYLVGSVNDVESEDGHTHGPWSFGLITKDKTTHSEYLVRKNLDMVKTKLENVGLSTEDAATYTQFVQDSESYLQTMANVYPWKYVEITTPEVPKLPISLVRVMNELPG